MAVCAFDIPGQLVRPVAVFAICVVPLVYVAAFFCKRMALHAQVVIVLPLILDQAYIQFLFTVAVETLQIAGIASIVRI
jgi:hypothetical protein